MGWVKTILQEIYGLFVDDGSFALAVLGCLGAAYLAATRLPIRTIWSGYLLFAGLALIVLESVTRFARQSKT